MHFFEGEGKKLSAPKDVDSMAGFPVCKLGRNHPMRLINLRLCAYVCNSIFFRSRQVEYDVTGFLEKNRDTLPPGVMDILRQSDNTLVSSVFKGK